MVYFFLKQTCAGMKIDTRGILPEALSFLLSRQWAGNVRELQNYVRRLVVFSGSEDISRKTIQLIETQGEGQGRRDAAVSRMSGLSRVAIGKMAKRLGVAVERFRE